MLRTLAAVSLGLLLITASLRAQVVPIGELHRNNADGTPASPYSVGTTVTVSGVVTVGAGVLASNYLEIYVQDSTGAVCVYAPSFAWQVETGDSVTVTGTIDQFRGLTEVSQPSQLVVHGKAVRPPQPLDLTCWDVQHSFLPDYSEPNESRLIRLRDVTFRGTGSRQGVLLDSTGACTIYLDPDAGVTMPPGKLTVMGILKQYDPDPPYTGGYEIVPRFQEDVRPAVGPAIVEGPTEVQVTPTSVTFAWTTDVPSLGRFEYGRTKEYELGEVVEAGPATTNHTVTLTGLTPATVYHGRAVATDSRGSSQSDDLIFCSASPEESTGEILVFFNQTVDTSRLYRKPARGKVNLGMALAERLAKANYSIDACFYTLTDEWVSDALITAHRRGVKVRVIVEHDNRTPEVYALQNEGIPVIDDTFGSNSGDGQMHNKFVIIDARDTTSAADDWVWTGSYNPTVSGATRNAENAILVQDQALARAYTMEFEEMWGSSGDQPSADSSRFGPRKTDNTPHRFNVDGMWVEAYFSPSDRTTAQIVRAIESADNSALFCIYSFTRDEISLAFRRKWESGVLVAGVFENENVDQYGAEWPYMSGTGPNGWPNPADVHLDLPTRLLHHKYLLIDVPPVSPLGTPDPMVLTGSHNWTTAAETANDENLLIVHDATVANLYLQEFVERYRESGGTDDRITAVAEAGRVEPPGEFTLSVFPNPASSALWLKCYSPRTASGRMTLEIFDVRGRRVRHWVLAPATRVGIRWTGRDENGRIVPSGVYLAVLRSKDGHVLTRRFVLLR